MSRVARGGLVVFIIGIVLVVVSATVFLTLEARSSVLSISPNGTVSPAGAGVHPFAVPEPVGLALIGAGWIGGALLLKGNRSPRVSQGRNQRSTTRAPKGQVPSTGYALQREP